MCEICLSKWVQLQVEFTADEMLDIELKEHTVRFKQAVERCKRQTRSAHPDMSDKDLASRCFAVVTKTFKRMNYPIFASSTPEVELTMSEGIMKVQLVSEVEPVVQELKLPINGETLIMMMSKEMRREVWEKLNEEFKESPPEE
jgi:hypothetical protein